MNHFLFPSDQSAINIGRDNALRFPHTSFFTLRASLRVCVMIFARLLIKQFEKNRLLCWNMLEISGVNEFYRITNQSYQYILKMFYISPTLDVSDRYCTSHAAPAHKNTCSGYTLPVLVYLYYADSSSACHRSCFALPQRTVFQGDHEPSNCACYANCQGRTSSRMRGVAYLI